MFKTIVITFKLYVTKSPLVITRVRMLHFTRYYGEPLQRRLTILMSFCSKFIRVYSACVPIIIQIKKDLSKFASQCITVIDIRSVAI